MTYVTFETIIHYSRHNFSVVFQLRHYTLSTKVAHQRANFQNFHCLLKVHQIHHVIFLKQKISFSPKFRSFFSVMRDNPNPSVLFLAETTYDIDRSSTTWKCKFLELPVLALKCTKFCMTFLEPKESVFLQTSHHSSVSRDISPLYFFI